MTAAPETDLPDTTTPETEVPESTTTPETPTLPLVPVGPVGPVPTSGAIERILALRLGQTGLTQHAIAYRLGMSTNALGDRMRGRTRWSAYEIPVVCQLVGVGVSDLYDQAQRLTTDLDRPAR